MTSLKCFLTSLSICVNLFCLVKGTRSFDGRLVECCISCIAGSRCPSFLYSTENGTCVQQDDTRNPALFAGMKIYSLVQLQEFGNKMFQFKARAVNISMSKRNKPETDLSANKQVSSSETCDCPRKEVRTFHKACSEGKLVEVRYILALHTAIIDCRGEFGRTALLTAVFEGHLPVFNFLKDKKANMQAVDEDNNNIVHMACLGGHVDMVKYVLSLNVTYMEIRGRHERTPLLTAVYNGHLPVVKLLKKRGANFKAVDENNDTNLHLACHSKNVDMVKYVLSLNITDLESRGRYGRSPLLKTVREGNIAIVNLLKERGANLAAVDEDNDNILHTACLGGLVDMVKYVLSLNVTDMESRGGHERTPLLTAVYNGHLPVVKLLKKRGANVKAVEKYNDNILHFACLSENVDMVKYVLSLNITDLESRGRYGRSPLLKAVCDGHIAIVNLLKERGANLAAVDENNDNILHLACLSKNLDMVKYVLSLNITDLESRGRYGRSPLLKTVREGNIAIVNLLKERGANLAAVDEDNDNILHTACLGGLVDMVKYVLSLNVTDMESRGGHERTPLLTAVYNGRLPVVKLMKKRGANVKAVEKYNNNILHFACLSENLDMVKYVLSLNITDMESSGRYGRSPLLKAVCRGNIAIVNLLKERGANLAAVDADNDNILHTACLGGHEDMVQYVLSLNVTDMESRGEFGRTPLMKAVRRGCVQIVKLLKSYGAKLTALDDLHFNVLHLACEKGHVDMMKYLVNQKELFGFERMRNRKGHTPLQVAKQKGHENIVVFLQK